MSRRVLVFGNSGAGKSTLSRRLAAAYGLAHLDLDTLAWKDTTPPARAPLDDSETAIQAFTGAHEDWVIEGCYTDLLELVAEYATEIIYLDLPVETCVDNARRRPWEPHKYASQVEQDANLGMLLRWIRAYPERDDTFSATAHRRFFDAFDGDKQIVETNADATAAGRGPVR